jgi:putative membrane protein
MIAEIQTIHMVIWMMKFVHVAAIAVWASGLVATPFLLVQKHRLGGGTVHRLHRLVRALHVQIVSPAAFIAVATGIALIFLRETFFVWFSTKLYLVALLAACHVGIGLLISSTFEPEGRLGTGLAAFLVVTIVTSVAGILVFVLAKPAIDLDAMAGEMAAGGWLEDSVVAPVVEALISWTR